MTKKKPWNRVSLPVYSISSKTGSQENMNIITYASFVSMQPKRIMVAIYHGTKTLENAEANPHFVLQLLAASQYNLVNQLGKQSGISIPKMQRLQKRKLLSEWNGFKVLKNALAVLELKAFTQVEGGDHRMFLCEVVAYKNLNDGEPLTTTILHEKGIIRI
ncbi:MAG: flavin reductase family protein [Chitinophagaceae bacterium]